MLENQEDFNLSNYNNRTESLPKQRIRLFSPEKNLLHERLDKNCLYKFQDTLVCIEYPGNVKNVDKAIEHLGGIEGLQKALDGKKLELSFHPKNQYMKGCMADLNQNMGLLVEVKQDMDSQEPSYEILGASDTCFKFTKMCDFKYLPLLARDKPESKDSEVEYVHDKVILDKIPNLQWFTRKESKINPLFLVSSSFARFDQPQIRFQSNSIETFNSMVRADAPQLSDSRKTSLKQKIFPSSIRVSLIKSIEIPDKPPPAVFENVKTKFLQQHVKLVRQIFEERPIWTKSGVMHKLHINVDSVKVVLPCIAYYCYAGPWRTCWIKFGYNPFKDFNSRIYQILDFRIRHAEGMQIKVKSKRTTSNNIAKDFITRSMSGHFSDLNYIIRPSQIPPARQMFYQYCDILIPEVQEMLLKLPKLPSSAIFDAKNGWLPLSFQEHCREIVNRYIFDAVQQELVKEQNAPERNQDVATYCSKMLSNIKKGVSQSIGEYSGDLSSQENIVEEINLSDDEQIDANEVVNSLPERLPVSFDEEEADGDYSDLEIDMEAIEEINELVAGLNDQKLAL